MAEGKKVLVEIDMALLRVEDGSYGLCEGLGVPIEKNRLEAIPWTRYSMEYARMQEKGQTRHNLRHRPLDIDREPDYQDQENADSDRDEPDENPDHDEQDVELPDNTLEPLDDEQAEPDEQEQEERL